MRLFSSTYNTWKKSEAAALVQSLLEHQVKAGWLSSDPALLANILVAEVWDQKPDVFNGKFGQRPHKISVAASALANRLHSFDHSSTDECAILFSLVNIISELEMNDYLYPFNSLDLRLLQNAALICADIGKRISSTSNDYGSYCDRRGTDDVVQECRPSALSERPRDRLEAIVRECGLRVVDESDDTHLAAAAAAHITRTVINRCGWEPKGLSEERKFAATVFSVVAANHCSRLAGAGFEISHATTALELFWAGDPSAMGSLIREATDEYNRMLANPIDYHVIKCVGDNIAAWVEEEDETALHKLSRLLKVIAEAPIRPRSTERREAKALPDPDGKPPASSEQPTAAQPTAQKRRRAPARGVAFIFAFLAAEAIAVGFSYERSFSLEQAAVPEDDDVQEFIAEMRAKANEQTTVFVHLDEDLSSIDSMINSVIGALVMPCNPMWAEHCEIPMEPLARMLRDAGAPLPAGGLPCDRATVHTLEACLPGFEVSPSPNGEQLYLTTRRT